MSTNIAAVLGAATVIAAAILFTNHWEIIESSQGVMRLDRWNGAIALCALDPDSLSRTATSFAGARVLCK